MDHGIFYTRISPIPSLPIVNPVQSLSLPNGAVNGFFPDVASHAVLEVFSNSDWTMDICYFCLITGIVFQLAGGTIAWKTRVQPTVAFSTAKAEFLAAADAGKHALYLRSILNEAGLPQLKGTKIHAAAAAAIAQTDSLAVYFDLVIHHDIST